MILTFKAMGAKEWIITETGILFNYEYYAFNEITEVRLQKTASSSLINGVIVITARGKQCFLAFPFKQKVEAEEALTILKNSYGRAEEDRIRKDRENEGIVYQVNGVRGRKIKVFEDRCVMKVTANLGSFFTGNVSDGEKTIYYADCVGVQFKEAGIQIGYLQLETASNIINQRASNFFNENSFTFDISTTTNEKMREIRDYIQGQIRRIKNGNQSSQSTAISAADEIKKYKELLDMGILTQEEFDLKKKQLLDL